MSITVVPSAITGQTLSAAQWNTQVRDNINGIWVLTTGGDMLYATGAAAAARLALVTGGVMYGGASAPAWLATPSVASVLRKLSGTGAPDWLALTAIPGILHTKGTAFSNSSGTTTSTSYGSIGLGLYVDLTLSVTCTVLALAFGAARKNSGSYEGYFKLEIDSTIDPNENMRFRNTVNGPYFTAYYRTGITAGTRRAELKYRTENAADGTIFASGAVIALAFPE